MKDGYSSNQTNERGTFEVVDNAVCISIYLLTFSPRQLLHQIYPFAIHTPGPGTKQPKEKKLAKDPPSELKKGLQGWKIVSEKVQGPHV